MIKIDISGFDKALADVNSLATKAKQDVKLALVDFGTKVESHAKRLAPADEVNLRSSINSDYDATNMTVTITAASDYAAYMEFGTRKFAAQHVATLPQDWKTYAATFKGKGGGDYFEFLNAILDWVKRKGIVSRYSVKTKKAISIKIGGKGKTSLDDQNRLEEAAYAIALSILRNGVRHHPFLYPAVKDKTPKLISDIKKIFK